MLSRWDTIPERDRQTDGLAISVSRVNVGPMQRIGVMNDKDQKINCSTAVKNYTNSCQQKIVDAVYLATQH